MEINDIKKVIESLLFVSDKPLSNRQLAAVLKEDLQENIKVEDVVKELQADYEQLDRSFEIKYVAGGWTFATKTQYSPWIRNLLKEKTVLKLSPSAMEVLAIIAYKQPITRAEIDTIRGVDPGGVIDTLTDRKFIKIVGRKETLGKPLLYGTTQEFLKHFGLNHLSELPVIENEKELFEAKKEVVQEMLFDNQANLEKEEEKAEEQPQSETANEQSAINDQNETAEKVKSEDVQAEEVRTEQPQSTSDAVIARSDSDEAILNTEQQQSEISNEQPENASAESASVEERTETIVEEPAVSENNAPESEPESVAEETNTEEQNGKNAEQIKTNEPPAEQ